jgi:hypothetical protein
MCKQFSIIDRDMFFTRARATPQIFQLELNSELETDKVTKCLKISQTDLLGTDPALLKVLLTGCEGVVAIITSTGGAEGAYIRSTFSFKSSRD